MTSRNRLILVIVAIVVVWQLPYGTEALYPFTLLATYAHEMGHGLSALLLGADFDRLTLYADGSGMAVWRGDLGRAATAAVAAGGLLGPSLAGALLLAFARSAGGARWLLAGFAVCILLSVVLWVRNPFGAAFLLATAGAFLLAARWLSDTAAAFLLNVLAALLCLSWFRDLGYLFSPGAVVDGVAMPSDTGLISRMLWLPYWFWGAVVATLSLAVVAVGLWWSTRSG